MATILYFYAKSKRILFKKSEKNIQRFAGFLEGLPFSQFNKNKLSKENNKTDAPLPPMYSQ
jgi:hypothetical protein